MKLRFIYTILLITLFFGFAIGQAQERFQPSFIIEKLSKDSGGLYKFSIYNNSDSVLCILTSVFGQYNKNQIDTLIVYRKLEKILLYQIDFVAKDDKFDSYLSSKGVIFILPFQEKSFNFFVSEVNPVTVLRTIYIFKKGIEYPRSLHEAKTPYWYNKYNLFSTDIDLLTFKVFQAISEDIYLNLYNTKIIPESAIAFCSTDSVANTKLYYYNNGNIPANLS